jgi:alkyl hydroperoxide reductase subunit AhpC
LLGDWPRYEVGRKYNVYNDERAIHIRATYVVDRDGIVRAALIEREGGKHPPFALEAVRRLAEPAAEP